MEIVPFEHVGAKVWDSFCATSPSAWLRHTTSGIDFGLALQAGNKNLSFALADAGGRVIAIVPLVVQNSGNGDTKEFAMGGTPIPFPACALDSSEQEKTEVLKCALEEIGRLAKEIGVTRVSMFVDPLTDPIITGQMQENPLLSFGFRDDSIETTCIDLTQSEQMIFNTIAKGHRSDIHFAEKQPYRIELFDRELITDDLCEHYKELYFAAAGREVGTPQRWAQTFQQIKEGYGVLIFAGLSDEESYTSGNVVQTYKGRAYYALSATRRDRRLRGIGALMQWKTMRFLKQKAFTHYELGWLVPSTKSQKEIDISHFKSLFGGKHLPLFRAEKYYDPK